MSENKLRIYPVPEGAVMQEDYCLRIRPAGTEEWKELKAYRVKVDMHDVRPASMAYFDFEGEAEVEITFRISLRCTGWIFGRFRSALSRR